MITCMATECVMPARTRPLLRVLPAKHWGDAESLIRPPVCFCDIHRSDATMELLFGTKARRAMDYSFMRANKPLPDWSRCTLDWEAVDPSQSALPEVNGGVPS